MALVIGTGPIPPIVRTKAFSAIFPNAEFYSYVAVWLITGHDGITKAIIVFSYLFVCSFAITIGPTSWTYPAEIFPMKVRAKAVSMSTASNWAFNTALAFAVPPGLANIVNFILQFVSFLF